MAALRRSEGFGVGAAAAGRPAPYDVATSAHRLYDDVLAGLSSVPRRLPPKYFYDDAGARLFERITQLPAYYLTRTELSILRRHIAEIAAAIGRQVRVLELGSGSGRKTRLLLRHLLAPAGYVPVDISRAQLRRTAAALAREFPALDIQPLCADYTGAWSLAPARTPAARTVAFFPGSTIGNFEDDDALAFLARVRRLCGPRAGLLIGADLHKGRATLEAAYDDPAGVTAAFNLNLLRRINRECGADFDMDVFRHHAFYDEARHRIEMRLVARRATVATLPARVPGDTPAIFEFAAGDFVTTEYSHKYTPDAFRALTERAGWACERCWTDERAWFSVWLLRRAD